MLTGLTKLMGLDKKVGELNGIWAILLRLVLVLVIPWGVWITSHTFEFKAYVNAGDRWTEKDALKTKIELLQLIDNAVSKINERIEKLPPPDFVKRVDAIEADVGTIKDQIVEIRLILAKEKP